jgi:hypothetical protein
VARIPRPEKPTPDRHRHLAVALALQIRIDFSQALNEHTHRSGQVISVLEPTREPPIVDRLARHEERRRVDRKRAIPPRRRYLATGLFASWAMYFARRIHRML